MTDKPKGKTLLDLFPTPEFLMLSSVGIVVSDSDTKFVRLQRQMFKDGFELAHANRANNPQGAVEAGVIKNPNDMVPVLKELCGSFNIHYAHATLPEEKAYLFTTFIDNVPYEGLRDAVAFILEENVPVSLADSVFDFEIVERDMSSGKLKVTVTVLPKEVVSAYTNLFEMADITPVSFSIESQAIARAVVENGNRAAHLIVNLSRKKTGFYVVSDEVVQFSTTSSASIGEGDAYPSLNDIRAEMGKVVTFWDMHTDRAGKMEKKIEKIILCGFGASKKDFVDQLMSENDIPYTVADVQQNMASVKNSRAVELSQEESLEYVSAIGLVLPDGR